VVLSVAKEQIASGVQQIEKFKKRYEHLGIAQVPQMHQIKSRIYKKRFFLSAD